MVTWQLSGSTWRTPSLARQKSGERHPPELQPPGLGFWCHYRTSPPPPPKPNHIENKLPGRLACSPGPGQENHTGIPTWWQRRFCLYGPHAGDGEGACCLGSSSPRRSPRTALGRAPPPGPETDTTWTHARVTKSFFLTTVTGTQLKLNAHKEIQNNSPSFPDLKSIFPEIVLVMISCPSF